MVENKIKLGSGQMLPVMLTKQEQIFTEIYLHCKLTGFEKA